MTINGYNPVIPELVGQRIMHTAPGYGPGSISQAYLTDNSEIYVRISFDNARVANPFSLVKCVNKGLIILENPIYNEDILNQIISAKTLLLRLAVQEEEKRRREEAERIAAERKRREEEMLAAFLREQEQQRREAEERAALEQEERERQAEEKKRIFDYLESRNVQFLVHFTPSSNLPSILSHGIMPRSVLSDKGIHADTPDELRYDFRMDYSSFSIAFPNYRVFYSKRMNTPFTYVVLIIDPQLILDLPLISISYLPDNAASGLIRNVEQYTGFEAVKALFPETVQIGKSSFTREQLSLPDHFTTNPQAEVFIRSTIEPKYIRSIITIDAEQANRVREQLRSLPVRVPKIIYNREFYRPRVDWRAWGVQSDTPEE